MAKKAGSFWKACAWASIGWSAVKSFNSWIEKGPLTTCAAFVGPDAAGGFSCGCLSHETTPSISTTDITSIFIVDSIERAKRCNLTPVKLRTSRQRSITPLLTSNETRHKSDPLETAMMWVTAWNGGAAHVWHTPYLSRPARPAANTTGRCWLARSREGSLLSGSRPASSEWAGNAWPPQVLKLSCDRKIWR